MSPRLAVLAAFVLWWVPLHAGAQAPAQGAPPTYAQLPVHSPPQAEPPPDTNIYQRIGYSTLGTLLGTGLNISGVFLGGYSAAASCDSEGFGCIGEAILGVMAGFTLSYPAIPLGTYFGGKLGGSQGRWWVALVGSALGLVQVIAGTIVVDDAADLNGRQERALLMTNATFATFWPIAMLEWSHQRRVRRTRSDYGRVQFEPHGLGIRARF